MAMSIGETARSIPTVQVPTWDDQSFLMGSPFSLVYSVNHCAGSVTSPKADNVNSSPFDALTTLQRYLPSNMNEVTDDSDVAMDAFSSDHFRMFEFKVRKCTRSRSHDWTECPYAHPAEKARRRDPRKFHYSGSACPEFRKGHCRKGDACEFAHGVFECWLHPARYRTQPCKDGTHCLRRVCFFAHTPNQLRVLPQTSPRGHVDSYDGPASRLAFDSYDGSPSRLGMDPYLGKASFGSSPTSILHSELLSPPPESPPTSPQCLNSVAGLTDAVRNLQFGKARMSISPPAWGVQMGSGICSPRSPATLRPGFLSLPSTLTRAPARSGQGGFDIWDKSCEEEPVMERVESGKDLRAKMYAKLSNENSLDGVFSVFPGPDVGWVSELVK